MPTVAVKKSTLEKLKRLMREEHAESLDETINLLIEMAQGIPKSIFGVDKNKRIRLTEREHEAFQKSHSL